MQNMGYDIDVGLHLKSTNVLVKRSSLMKCSIMYDGLTGRFDVYFLKFLNNFRWGQWLSGKVIFDGKFKNVGTSFG